ncbi:MAG: hypothetical protein LC107_08130 [Chitinophagales bacterium]|nr:hypothetical protein [Chitinophagales bacterium]
MAHSHINDKPRLLILSDLWGWSNAPWIELYLQALHPYFDFVIYDSCVLAELSADLDSEALRHTAFIHGGIERAVDKLLLVEKSPVWMLAFSIGGYIAWKAAQQSLSGSGILAVSATRLRLETEQANFPIHLIYGANDPFKPEIDWFETMQIDYEIYSDLGHDLYTLPEVIPSICQQLIKIYQSS